MNFSKKFGAVMLCVLFLCVSMMLGACGNEPTSAPTTGSTGGEVEYRVTVVDGAGTPYTTGVIVQFMQGGEKVALQTVDANGVAAKTLAKGDYTVELMFTGNAEDYFYDNSGLTLSADKTELEIILAQSLSAETQTLFVAGKEHTASYVQAGSTHVELSAEERSYFLFAPATAGTYQFSVSDSNAQIGYYGAPHFVQENSAAEVVDGAFTMSISSSMIGTGNSGTTVLVLGIDGGEADSCVLTIERIGEPEYNIAEEPWIIYQAAAKPVPYTLPAGASLMSFDLTAASGTYELVLNEADGFYHLGTADGPLVLMYLSEDVQYLDCFKTILEHTGVQRYFFDENGEYLKKESYSECLLEYIDCADADKGVYPLTEDLKYIVQMEGEDAGWFDSENSLYLFKDANGININGINEEISWLFMCCYLAK